MRVAKSSGTISPLKNLALVFFVFPFLLVGCGGKKAVKQDQSYSISFQRQDKTNAEKPKRYFLRDKEFEVISDNYVKGEIKGISTIDDLGKLKGMIETLKFAVMQYDVGQSSEPTKPSN